MKVLFQSRANALAEWGGDTTQMVRTKEALENLGIEVDISLDTSPKLDTYDIVHVFNIQTAAHGIQQIRNARKHDVPIALSTIYWDRRHMLRSNDYLTYHSNKHIRQLSRICKPLAVAALCSYRSSQQSAMQEMVETADILLPNSVAEVEIIVELFSMPSLRTKTVVVPNAVAVDADVEQSESTQNILASLPAGFLLQVASFDPGKGQLNLIRALMDKQDIPLVFIGKGSNVTYLSACRLMAEIRGNTYFIDHIPHDQIHWFYRQARVHALPSLRESPGLATLEAAVNGANCVVSIHGPVTEYFGNDVWFCDPLKPDSIHTSVNEAWHAPRNTALRERIIASFTWDEAAYATLQGYEWLLRNRLE